MEEERDIVHFPRFGDMAGVIRVALLCRLPREQEHLAERLSQRREAELCDGHARSPDVGLCAAAAARTLVAMLRSLPQDPRPPVVLLDLEEEIGAAVAGHHGCFGYLPGDATTDDLWTALYYARRHRPYTLAQHVPEFSHGRESGPLTSDQVNILSHLCLGLTQRELGRRLFISRSSIQANEEALRERFELGKREPLDGIAVDMGFTRAVRLRPG